MLPAGKAMLVYSRLAPLVRASGLGTFAAYIAMSKWMPRNCARRSMR
jgi:chemotaxis protein methyltransferase CheR